MFSFDASHMEDTFLRPCVCSEEDRDEPKSYCYVEGTNLDKSRSDTIDELSENIWFETKPPRLFSKDITPLITARQIHISRIIMSGAGAKALESPDEEPINKKVVVNMTKKKSAVKFLSNTEICLD
ncbi:hypothetical protein NQ314_009973 [Rhamnusium bicolor]|uniref:Uncharacterized protein n=1 Tax=Rhamnusium bicolor TaxID=1586634 RepID=A0AAV8XWW0_9CUCU|nr:hypothetical protein NQ314_009973 [Rhamnusium bicolor]